MPPWLKPEMVLSAAIGVIGMGGTVLLNWSAQNVRYALNDQVVADLKSDMKDIKTAVGVVPIQAERLSQLERFRSDATGMFGALDGRLRVVEGATMSNSGAIEDIRRASGVKLR